MQFQRMADGKLEPLPARVIDTGMGFERLCMALQGKTSNYDTDVFTPLIDKIAELSGYEYGKDKRVDIAMRVIADHTRTIAFSIADSQLLPMPRPDMSFAAYCAVPCAMHTLSWDKRVPLCIVWWTPS